MATDSSVEQTRLLIGVLAHISRYLETGCSRAAHQAVLLLRCLDASTVDEELIASCEQLDLAISHPRYRAGATTPRNALISSRPRSSSSPASGSPVSFPN